MSFCCSHTTKNGFLMGCPNYKKNGRANEILELWAYVQTPPLDARHADVFNEARVLQFGLRLYLHPYFVCASRVKTLTSLRICAGSPEPSLLGNSINILISCAHSFLVLSVTDAIFKAKEVNRLLKLLSTGKGPFAKPDRRILEWELKKIGGIKDGTELDGGIGEHKLHIKPEEQNRILWVYSTLTTEPMAYSSAFAI